jgi:ABC-2 type transport system permease protein
VTRVVMAELLKLRTTRTFWWLGGAAVGLVLLIVVLNLWLDDQLRSPTDIRSLLSTAGISGLLTLVLGVVAGAGDYRHGTIASTLLVTPQRLRAVSATVMACFLGGLLIGLMAAGMTALIALPWLSAKEAVVVPSFAETFEIFLGGVLYAALAAGLGAALGALLRNQVAAVVIVLVLIFVVDPTLSALVEDVGQFTLTGLGIAMSGGTDDSDVLPRGVAAALWALYTILLGSLAAIVTARRDI